ncbi:hypothetical protein PNIG_a1664 [Pseudoalteromonas nigrifaciens]|uniref:Uncharacterized protein n=1 Tax=Pseudoalteromonas nigrifaciens TaxID=28109 RepID=A0AAC9UHH7_9GAMM|nr:hypothetical protein [Pseudoalteromonas nigrifaciens]ASM53789.1 hypothetical protein PNIG_a1664 [Pseudoalteromonas nigrifaciens]
MLTYRRKILPHEDDSELNIARAAWLLKRQREDLETLVANAVCKAFGGK